MHQCYSFIKHVRRDVILKTHISAGTSVIEVIEKPKENEPPADPAHATIKPNKETVIEINVNQKPLGLFVTGGKMLQPPVVN